MEAAPGAAEVVLVEAKPKGMFELERVMDLGENRIEMRIPRSARFLRDLRFPHS
jgi:hypothetical protein